MPHIVIQSVLIWKHWNVSGLLEVPFLDIVKSAHRKMIYKVLLEYRMHFVRILRFHVLMLFFALQFFINH